ncbi:MAG TPA: ABC transporter permease [Cyclobacteriaceae bacterium]|nr:ABC transporter permease [Cyclobacteriaceae bacterium]
MKNKLSSFINVSGLALAMASCILIYLFVSDELSYDRYHKNADRIYRVTRNFISQDGSVSLHLGHVAPPFAPLLKNDFGEIEEIARALKITLLLSIEEDASNIRAFNEDNIFIVEPAAFKIFDIPVISGNPEKDFEKPYTIMLSRPMAEKYFGKDEPVGKRLRAGNSFDLEVSGIFEPFPRQSHWHPEFIISFSTLNDSTLYGRRNLETNWGNNSFATYLLVQEFFDPAAMEARFPEFIDKHFGEYAKANFGVPADFKASDGTTLFLQKLTDIHLRSHLDSEVETNGNINNVYMMSVIGIFIILIACINFVNLATARASKRAKEVGLRKVVGAHKQQLISQFLSESVLTATLSLLLAFGIVWFALPWLNDFTGKGLVFSTLLQPQIVLVITIFTILTGLLAGLYPAFIISAYNPATTLKGQKVLAKGKPSLRKTLVVLQFSVTVVLIIATVTTYNQLNFLNERDIGYNKDQVLTLPYYSEMNTNYDALYNELTSQAFVKNAGRSSRIPTGRLLDSMGAQAEVGDSLIATSSSVKFVRVDHEFFDSYDVRFEAGRSFSKEVLTDDSLGYVINESAVHMIGWANAEEAIGKGFRYGGIKGTIIGVVSDFHFESLHENIVPLVFIMRQPGYNRLSVKVETKNLKEAIIQIEKVWHEFLRHRPFEYNLLSDQYHMLYEAEQKQGQLFSMFSGLAIFIACLGLLGLTTFTTLQRVKEIGIRKVLGASTSGIMVLLSKELLLLILIANLVAWPTAWYFMKKWLSNFAYRIDLGVETFIVSGLLAALIALITISTQAIKAAVANPVNALRNE